ncbi:hypothetical protein GWK16_06550 [Roseomonas sp. JC162]|uniref:Uncharacterized protein n=1 Tax=Neoroseomonas marina TaxID=1232220 RepID=A0A848EBQ8_9PROT|nr:hypothetical protein [Neoroseomonas marina]NMJ40893.1 hypothetical protein [Neoroseomonas marina]
MTAATSITVRVPLKIRRRPGRKTVVTPLQDCVDAAIPTRADPALVKALARAFRYQRLLDEDRYASITDMAAGEKIDRGYLGRLLRLSVLAPDIIEALLNRSLSKDACLAWLMEPQSTNWEEQRNALLTPLLPGSRALEL